MPNAFYYGDLNNIKVSNPTIGQWFNTAGCVLPGQAGPGDVAGSARPALHGGLGQAHRHPARHLPGAHHAAVRRRRPQSHVRPAEWQPGRDFKFKIKDHPVTFQVRGDVLNVMNHSLYGRRQHRRDQRRRHLRRDYLRFHGSESLHPDSGPYPLVIHPARANLNGVPALRLGDAVSVFTMANRTSPLQIRTDCLRDVCGLPSRAPRGHAVGRCRPCDPARPPVAARSLAHLVRLRAPPSNTTRCCTARSGWSIGSGAMRFSGYHLSTSRCTRWRPAWW